MDMVQMGKVFSILGKTAGAGMLERAQQAGGSAGLDTSGQSIPYIAGWGEDGALDTIREYAQTIDTIARRIEDALDRAPDTPPAAKAVGVDQIAG
jgi:hypothetical protein